MNFEIEKIQITKNNFLQNFEKYFKPEEILNNKSSKWKFKPLNSSIKISTLKSHVLIIRSQYNEYRKLHTDISFNYMQNDNIHQKKLTRRNILSQLKNKKIYIFYSDSRRLKREKDCFLKINSKGIYLYQKYLCFEGFLGHIVFDSITKIFYLKQHIIFHSK